MKRIGIFLFVFSLALTSCSKDDDTQDQETLEDPLLIGEWIWFGFGYREVQILRFNSDGTGEEIEQFSEDSQVVKNTKFLFFAWTTSNNTLTFNYANNGTESHPYSISGNQLTIIINNEAIRYTRN